MKPENWDGMADLDKQDTAKRLLDTVRGQFIISQALVIAVDVLRAEKYPEESNAQDMEMLLELFPIYSAVHGKVKGK